MDPTVSSGSRKDPNKLYTHHPFGDWSNNANDNQSISESRKAMAVLGVEMSGGVDQQRGVSSSLSICQYR